jgi:hypothetical protein
MPVMVMNRYKGGSHDDVTQLVKEWKALMEKYGVAETIRLNRFHTGPFTGEWLFVVRYPDWSAYEKYQDVMARDPGFGELIARAGSMQHSLVERVIAVEVEI